MQEIVKKPKGYFKIESIKDGKVIDSFEEHNLIMDDARRTMPKHIAGISGVQPINKLVLGTQGHIAGDFLAPKSEVNGFVSSREMLFSEETGTEGEDYSVLTFNPSGVSGDTVNTNDNISTAKVTVIDTNIIYEFNIDNRSANGNGTIIYTEAALYTGDKIFAMRTFKGKIKDDSVTLRIIWKILF